MTQCDMSQDTSSFWDDSFPDVQSPSRRTSNISIKRAVLGLEKALEADLLDALGQSMHDETEQDDDSIDSDVRHSYTCGENISEELKVVDDRWRNEDDFQQPFPDEDKQQDEATPSQDDQDETQTSDVEDTNGLDSLIERRCASLQQSLRSMVMPRTTTSSLTGPLAAWTERNNGCISLVLASDMLAANLYGGKQSSILPVWLQQQLQVRNQADHFYRLLPVLGSVASFGQFLLLGDEGTGRDSTASASNGTERRRRTIGEHLAQRGGPRKTSSTVSLESDDGGLISLNW